jgi:hypothetical protein
MAEVSRTGTGPFRFLDPDFSEVARWSFRVFCCTFLTIFFATPFYSFICVPSMLGSGRNQLPYCVAAILIWFLALIPPYIFGINQLALIQNTDVAALGLGFLSVSLLIGAITMLNALRHRSSPYFIFWLGVYPLATGVISLTCFLLSVSLSGGFRTGFVVIPLLGLGLAVLLLTAWLKWWNAVANYERELKASV